MKIGKILLGLLFVILVIEIIVMAPKDLGLEPEEVTRVLKKEEPNEGDAILQIIRGAHLVETREGEKEWELKSEQATTYKKKPAWSLTAVNTRFFGKDKVHFTVTGDHGIVNVTTKDMNISGKVKIKSSNGYLFQTDEVVYRSKERFLVAPKPVIMWGPKDKEGSSVYLKGQTLEADLNNALMTVSRDVRSEKTFKGDRKLLIKSQRADFSGKSNLAKFSGDVIMDFETMRITGPQAIFEYGDKSDMVKSVQVNGGVRVSDLDKWATSQNLNVNFEKDKYVFRGNPMVVQNNDELQGEEIIFLEGGKKVEVLKARAKVDKRRLEN